MSSKNVETALLYLRASMVNDYDTVAPLIGDGYRWIDRVRGVDASTPEELASELALDGAFTDRSISIDAVMETTDGAVVVQGMLSGTHAHDWYSIPATGRPVQIQFCDIFRFDEQGRIVLEDGWFDQLATLSQIGAIDCPFY